jgi:hypothetical protein
MAGRRRLISAHRALVLDTIHFARSVPTFPVEQTFLLASLAALRIASPVRISWTVLFLKAMARVAQGSPVLRRTFVPYPWPHVYEHLESVGAVAINRQCDGEDRLCWGRFAGPENVSLVELQESLDRFQREPVERIFRRQVRFSRFPTWIRRLAWQFGLYVDVAKRAKRFGSFSISSLAGQQTLNRFHPSIHTASLTYGPLDERGACLVTLICDHRVLDGAAAAAALHQLQHVLLHEIADELRAMSPARRAA